MQMFLLKFSLELYFIEQLQKVKLLCGSQLSSTWSPRLSDIYKTEAQDLTSKAKTKDLTSSAN